jgi:glycyl-tRNA synthetase beta chain
MSARDFLVELGTEELPPKALSDLSDAFRDGLASRLAGAGVAYRAIEAFATPRRLALLVRRLAEQAPDQQVSRRGPPLRAALDASGAPTRAGLAFAESCGVAFGDLGRETDPKGGEYLSWRGVKPGAQTAALLPAFVQESLDALPIPKRMRWGDGDAQFVRPVHWLVLLYGREVLPATMLGVVAGQVTRGHRFHAPKPIRLAQPSAYERTLEQRGHVIASFAKRKALVKAGVEALATELGGRALVSDALLDEVTALVEWPVPLAGRIDERFLQLPRELLVATIQDHQRYFPVEDASGALLPLFVTVSNIESRDPSVVRGGNERVVRPRLADAAFFRDQDRKAPLASRGPALDKVTFQAQLGSIGDKVRRVTALARQVALATGADVALTTRASELAKCDLVTNLVGEFPELQGIMGRYYAIDDGEPAEVATAIAEIYQPRGAGDALPATGAGLAIAIADRLDTLAGIFAIGQKPSGTRDPFGLRRAAIGVLRMTLEKRLDIDLAAFIGAAVRAVPVGATDDTADAVYDYVFERLRAMYVEPGDATPLLAGVTTEQFDAVLATRPASPLEFDTRLRALLGFLALPEAASLIAANKRIANLLKKSAGAETLGAAVDPARLALPAEQALHAGLVSADGAVRALLVARDHAGALARLAQLRPAVDAFFDDVMVMDPDPALRANRLALLGALRALFSGTADLSRLPG